MATYAFPSNRLWTVVQWFEQLAGLLVGNTWLTKSEVATRLTPVFRLKLEDFGLPETASSDEFIAAATAAGFTHCPPGVIDKILQAKPTSRQHGAVFLVPTPGEEWRLLAVGATGLVTEVRKDFWEALQGAKTRFVVMARQA